MRLLLSTLLICITIFSCQSQNTHQCPFDINHDIVDECGFVEVPRNRDSGSDATTQIAYLVIKSVSENKKPDPVVFLQGGPGGDVLKNAQVYGQLSIDSDRDFIIYDQRGIGFSEELCPNLNLELLDILSKDLTIESETIALQKQIQPCKDYILTDDRQFSTTTNAEDLEALRKHLGYKQLNLFGGSYGTRLGLKYMELYPKRVRSSILSGLFPPEVRMYDHLFSSFEKALTKVFNTCENDSECFSKYPNLKSQFSEVYKTLKTQPIDLSDEHNTFILNQQDALLFIHQMLYSPRTIRDIPNFIMALKSRNISAISKTINKFIPRITTINLAVYYAVMTADEGEFNNAQLLIKDSEGLLFSENGLSLFSADPEVIKDWPAQKVKLNTMREIESDIPTLLISGDFDPVTPALNGNLAEKHLKNSQHLVFNNNGHVPINNCFFTLAKQFLDEPNTQLKNECYKYNSAINWD